MGKKNSLNTSKKLTENPMGVAPVNKLIIQMGWPAMLSMLVNALYNVVDSIFLGMVSEEGIAAITLIYPIQLFIIAISVGSGVGLKSLVSRSLGERDYKKADQTASSGFFIAIFNGILWVIFTAFFAEDFVHQYYQQGYVAENAIIYFKICGYCAIFVNFQIICSNMIQATGKMKTAMFVDLSGAIVNLILDPILIFGLLGIPALGVEGAAIATVVGEFTAMLVGIVFIFKKADSINVSLKGFKVNWEIIKEIYQVGFPTMIMEAILPVLIGLYNGILAAVSATAVAVLGVYSRLESFLFMPLFGLMQGTLPLMAYNYGAGDKKRLLEVRKDALKLGLIFMVIGTLAFQLFPEELLGLFSASDEMLKMGVPALRIISTCFIPSAYGILCSTMFQAMGHGTLSLVSSIIRQLIIVLPLAYLLNKIGGVTISWTAIPCGEFVGVLYSFFVSKYLKKNEIDNLVKIEE